MRFIALAALATALLAATISPAEAFEIEYRYSQVSLNSEPKWNSFYSAAERKMWGPSFPGIQASIPTHGVRYIDNTGILLAALGGAAAGVSARDEAMRNAKDRGAKQGDSVTYSWTNPDYVPGAVSYIGYEWGSAPKASLDFAGGSGFQEYAESIGYSNIEFGAAFPTWRIWGPVAVTPIWEVLYRTVKFDKVVTPKTPPSDYNPVLNSQQAVAIQAPINAVFTVALPFNVLLRPQVGYDVVSGLEAAFAGGSHQFTYGLNAEWTPGALVRVSAGVNRIGGNLDTKAAFSTMAYSLAGSLYF
jgi:hypothetical protein